MDDLRLKQTIQYLCTTKIRYPLTKERINTWLRQFDKGAELTLGLLLLRHLIYRTNSQIESSLEQALRRAAIHFSPTQEIKENLNWRKILGGAVCDMKFMFGPPAHRNTPPGKSGELISRLLKSMLSNESIELHYPDEITNLTPDERYLLIDDGAFTGDQMNNFIQNAAPFMKNVSQTGVVVSIAHERALTFLRKQVPGINIFAGEIIKYEDGLENLSAKWISENDWTYQDVTPMEIYQNIVKHKGGFESNMPLGFGGLGLLVAYEHGIPDDSLHLLYGKSATWQPLITR